MQCASSTTSRPVSAASLGSTSSRNDGLLSRSGDTSSTSTSSAASKASSDSHSCAFVELIATARTPARFEGDCGFEPPADRRLGAMFACVDVNAPIYGTSSRGATAQSLAKEAAQ